MNKWRLLLFSIFAILHITTSERHFIDGRYRCYDHSLRILPSDKSFSYENNRERQFLPEIRQLNPSDNYPSANLRDTEIVRLSKRWQIREIKHHSRDGNRQTISPSVHIRDKRDDREQHFVESTYERINDLRSNLGNSRLARDTIRRDTEYQRNIRTTSLSREGYRKQYATRTPLENRDINRYNNIDRDMRNIHNRGQTRLFSDYDELNSRRFTNNDAMRIGFNHVRYTKTYDRYIREEPDLRNLRTMRSERTNDNKLSNDRNSRLGMQRDLNQDLSQGESRNDRRINLRSLDRMASREYMNSRLAIKERETSKATFDSRNENNSARSTRNINEMETSENREVRDDIRRKMNTRLEINERERVLSRLDRRNVHNNARSTRNTNEEETSENMQVRDDVRRKMNTRLEINERERLLSRLDRRNVHNNDRSTRNTNGKETSENREVRDDLTRKMNRVDMNARFEINERETVFSRRDLRDVYNNARSTRNINEISEDRNVRENVGPKINRVNMNTRFEMREREYVVSRPDRRSRNNNIRSTRSINKMETSENGEVRENVAPKMSRLNTNSKLEMREPEPVTSRPDRRIRYNNIRSNRSINDRDTSDNRENIRPKMSRVNMNSRLEMRELEPVTSRPDRRIRYNSIRSTRSINEMETSENRVNIRPKTSRVNTNFRLETRVREPVTSRPDRMIRNNSIRSTRSINEMETSENRENIRPKMNRVNMNSRLEMRERETVRSRFDRMNVHNNARSTRNINEKETSENRGVRDEFRHKMIRVNMNTRSEINQRKGVLSRFDRRDVHNNARYTRNKNEIETSENREVRDDFRHKMNRVNMNSRLEIKQRETVLSRLDRRNVPNNARSTRNINEIETSENREVRDDFRHKMNRVNMNSRLEIKQRETVLSRLDRRNVPNNARSTRNINEIESSENREVRDDFRHKMNRVNMNSRLEIKQRETVLSRLDRRNVPNNARSTRNINEISEDRKVRENVESKMSRVNMNTRLEMRERETVLSRPDRRIRNNNIRSTRSINEMETSENRENIGPKMNRVNMNSRLEMRERETVRSRFDRRKVNNNIRSTRNINEMETSENREVRDDFGHKINRVNMDNRLEMRNRDIRGTNENMRIVQQRQIEKDLYKDSTRIVRRNVPSQEFRVNELRRSERIQQNIIATNTMSRRSREALSLSPDRVRYDARRILRQSQYVRSRENRINIERDERQRSDRHDTNTDRSHINNLQRRVQTRASVRQDENRVTSRNNRNSARDNYFSRSATEIDNRQQSRNIIYEKLLSNRRHEARNARDERRQNKITQAETSIDMRRLAKVQYEDNEKPIPVQKLQYENHVFEMKWQYLFYALQAVYIFSIIIKMPKCKQENKHIKWISTWFTPTEYLKMD